MVKEDAECIKTEPGLLEPTTDDLDADGLPGLISDGYEIIDLESSGVIEALNPGVKAVVTALNRLGTDDIPTVL